MSKINTLALTLLITGSIDSIRNLPTAALSGSLIFFFFIFAAVTFLIPTALVSAELSSNINQGGIYQWVRLAFGERTGFLAVWLQWVNNVIWFPTMLSFIAGTAFYLIDPTLAQNKYCMMSVVLFVFWALTFANLRGMRVSAKFTSFCAITGLIIPMILIIALLITWVFLGKPIQLHLTPATMMPDWHRIDTWTSLTGIMLSFAGMELATVYVNDVENPKKSFPKALATSSVIILLTMVLGSLAIAFVLPANKIGLVDGTISSFSYFLSAYHLSWVTPILTVMLVIGSLGGIISWMVSPVKGIAQAATHGFMPAYFGKENQHGVPKNLLITQAVLVSIVCLVYLLLPTVNASYWLLSSLSLQLYILMYILMFFAALRLRYKTKYNSGTFVIPGKKIGLWLVCAVGLAGCALALFVGFFPPNNVEVGSKLNYVIIYTTGMVGMVLPVCFFYLYQARQTRRKLARLSTVDAVALETN
jgi:amino acid transporter